MITGQSQSSAFDRRNASDGHSPLPKWSVVVGVIASLGLVVGTTSLSRSQDKPNEADLKSQVDQFVKGLDASKATERQSAQDSLIKLGEVVLPHLPAADAEGLTAEQKRRLAEVRSALRLVSAGASLQPSKITLSAKAITLADAMAAIQRQSGNQIVDLREEFGQPVTNPEFPAEWKDKPFWEVLDEVAAKTAVGYYLHTGERQIGLIMEPPRSMPTTYAGPLRIQLQQLVRRISFEDGQKECALQFEIAWEPRIRPILFEIQPENLEVSDDQDGKMSVEAQPEQPNAQDGAMSLKSAVDGSMIRTDFIIRLSQPNRGAQKIKSLRGKMDVLMPADVQTFEFGDLEKTKNAKKQSGNVTVILEKFRALESHLWAADVSLQFESKSEAFESYETWFYDNECYLLRADGTRFTVNGGNTLTDSDEGGVGLQYRFVDAPGRISDYKLIYKSPATIVRDSVPFELKDIELP